MLTRLRHHGRRHLLVLALAITLALPGVARAAPEHQEVVSTDAADQVPQLVASAGIPAPHVDAIAEVGDTIIAAGEFDTVTQGGTTYHRTHIVAFDRDSGAVSTSFAPAFDGKVFALAGDPATGSVFVGGQFSTVNGVSRSILVKLDIATGSIDPGFVTTFSGGQINDLELTTISGTKHLFIGGTPARKLTSLNPVTGKDDKFFQTVFADAIPGAWGGVAIYQMAIDPSRTHLAVTGNFRTVGGRSRTRFAMFDLTGLGGTVSPWYYPGFAKPCASTAPRRIAYLQGVDWSPDGAFVNVSATGQIPLHPEDIWYERLGDANNPDTTVCDAVGRFALADPTAPVWINYTGGDSIWAVADTGPAVYVAGHFKWMDNPDGYASIGIGDHQGAPAVNRPGIAAVDPATGLALRWNPTLAETSAGGKAFWADDGGLWIGNDATRYGNEPHYGLAYAPLLPPPPPTMVLWAVGNACDDDNETVDCAQVGQLIAADTEVDAVLGLGDLQYEKGKAADWVAFYDVKLGAAGLKSITRPVPGNHDYLTADAAGYFGYWGAQAGDPAAGYYAFDLGAWKLVALNSNCSKVGGCGGNQPQGQFLRSALLEPGTCELVFDHHPAFSDGVLGDQVPGKSLFTVAYNNGAELMLSANDESYQRFAPAKPDGTADPIRGVTQLVVGTGGHDLTGFQAGTPRAVVRDNTTFGAVRLVLIGGEWSAEYRSVSGTVIDTSSGACR